MSSYEEFSTLMTEVQGLNESPEANLIETLIKTTQNAIYLVEDRVTKAEAAITAASELDANYDEAFTLGITEGLSEAWQAVSELMIHAIPLSPRYIAFMDALLIIESLMPEEDRLCCQSTRANVRIPIKTANVTFAGEPVQAPIVGEQDA
jgi:hypothetical protein